MNHNVRYFMDLNEASENLKKLKNRLKQTHKTCVNCDRRFPFWMTKNHCPYCGSSQVQWVFEREERAALI